MSDIPQQSAEDLFNGLFGASASGTGEEELLRIAAKYSLQISGRQVRCLLRLRMYQTKAGDQPASDILKSFIEKWLEWQQYHGSMAYVMRALDSIALRKFVNENTFKVAVNKQ